MPRSTRSRGSLGDGVSPAHDTGLMIELPSRSSRSRRPASSHTDTNANARASHARDTRHAAIATYAEPPSDDDALDDFFSDRSDGGDDVGVGGVGGSSGNSDSDSDDDDDDDSDFDVGRRSKRSLYDPGEDDRTMRSGPAKRRRLQRMRPRVVNAPNTPVTSTTQTQTSPRRTRDRGASGRSHRRCGSMADFISDRNDADEKTLKKSPKKSPKTPKRTSLPLDTLPYMVLVSVFEHAARPMTVDSVRWLAAAARTCRAFAEPALRVLYEKPPMMSMNMAHSLFDMLSRKRVRPLFPYHAKIRALSMDVGSLATHSYKGRRLDIAALIKMCPRLVHVDLRHWQDGPPYREHNQAMRWRYPDDLMEVLEEPEADEWEDLSEGEAAVSTHIIVDEPRRPLRLESWRWNYMMWVSLETMQRVHSLPSFSTLRSLTLVKFPQASTALNLTRDPLVRPPTNHEFATAMAALVRQLPLLTHLCMESCGVVDDVFFDALPPLKHLELLSCSNVESGPLAAYLLTSGQELTELTLHHNRGLSLEFLTVLGSACPRLEALRMNLACYSRLFFSGDAGPEYERLFDATQVPAWPTRLRVLELENLRRWDAPAAEMFFQSLVDAAPRLPDLRVLVIKAMLNIPWRQRSAIRDKWETALKDVFQRPWTPPKSQAFYDHVRAASDRSEQKEEKTEKTVRRASPPRRSSRIATGPVERSSRSTRGRSYREPDTDDSDSSLSSLSSLSDGTTDSEDGVGKIFVHGMCDIVDVRFDNQKPVEVQYTMEDFEDSEPDEDDEWTG